jgi:thiol-disulfide isomerase/thioredoxin
MLIKQSVKMKIKHIITLITILLTSITATLNGQPGHSVSLTIQGAYETKIKLAFHLGDKQYIKDSLITDKNGKGRFTGSEKLSPGVYMIVFPTNTFFEFLADEDQHFDISCSLNDPVSTLAFRGSDENTRFVAYEKKWKSLQEQATAISEKLKKAMPSGNEAASLRQQLSEQEQKMKQYLHETADSNKGTLLGAIARSIIPVESVTPKVPAGTVKPDSVSRLWSYLYYKDHFFDNIDFTQPGLIRSPVLGNKLDQFFSQMVIQMPDSINKEADKVLAMSEKQKDMFQYVAVWLFNRYATSEIMGHDGVVVHLADKIYLSGKAPWVSEEYINDLRKRVDRLRPNLIGNKAPELLMNSFAGYYVSLYDVKADFTILYFWEPDCGHCKEATPILKKYYEGNKANGIEVFAVCTHDDREKWEKYIVDNGLVWINGWDPDRLSRFDLLYNVESTPLVYILDKDKTIIAKRLAVEDIAPFIDNYRRYQDLSHASSGR